MNDIFYYVLSKITLPAFLIAVVAAFVSLHIDEGIELKKWKLAHFFKAEVKNTFWVSLILSFVLISLAVILQLHNVFKVTTCLSCIRPSDTLIFLGSIASRLKKLYATFGSISKKRDTNSAQIKRCQWETNHRYAAVINNKKFQPGSKDKKLTLVGLLAKWFKLKKSLFS